MSSDKIKILYLEFGLSAREIAKKTGMTVWQVIRFLKKNHIPRRTSGETQQLQFNRKPLSFTKKKSLNTKEKSLYQVGLMLYWAEGVKTGHGIVDFANCNDTMVKIFLRMLRTIYNLQEKRLRILLYCYANQSSNELINYWSKLLDVPSSQFTKPYIRKDFNEKKKNKMPHGLVHIRYNDKRLFMQILKDIDIIAKSFIKSWDDGVVKRACL